MNKSFLLAILLQLSVIAGMVIPSLNSLLDLNQLLKTAPYVNELQDSQVVLASPKDDELAPIISLVKPDQVVPKKYIIVYKDDVSADQVKEHQNWVTTEFDSMLSTLEHTSKERTIFKTNGLNFFNIMEEFSGYFGYFTDDLIKAIQASPLVKFIEKDSIVKVSEFDIQKDATWGLSRISHRDLSVSTDYLYDNEGGLGVTAYVVDTGIKTEHEDFEGRASWGPSVPFPHLKVDGHGHGTHCAGVIGSKTYGIAKKVELVAVSVMNMLGYGSNSDIIKGLEFVVNDHKEKVSTKKKGFKGSTVNMSIGGGLSESLDLAANAVTKAGLHVAVAAGNANENACDFSPARAGGPITVGASDNADGIASFSNWGACVDVFAPGVDILSTFIWSETTLMSGTSMASPHVAGLLSYFLSLQPDINSEFAVEGIIEPAALKSKVLKYATKGVITGIQDKDTPNLFIHNGAGGNLTDFWSL